MKVRIYIYVFFGLLCALGIGLYLANPNLAIFQVFMSFGASLIGAIFIAVTLESISSSKQRKDVLSIQKHLLASSKEAFKSFYLWLGNYLVRKFSITSFDYSNITSGEEFYKKLFEDCSRSEKEVNLENIVEFVSNKATQLSSPIDSLNHTINEEIATLITNAVVDEEDVKFFNDLKALVLDVQSSESFDELAADVIALLEKINSKQSLKLELNELLTDRLKRKFSTGE